VIALSRRQLICGGAAIAALATTPAIAASGIKNLPGGKTEVSLAANKALANVGGVVELTIKKYGKVALIRTSASAKGFAVVNLSCPHAGVTVQQNNGGWVCPGPRGHGSEFGLNGAVKVGPANSGLKPIKFTATSKAVTIA
jgi:Rieske Fe-S protein